MVLVKARDADAEAFDKVEARLVEAATIHSMNDLRRIASYWRQQAEREAALEGEEAMHARRRLHASVSFLGMVRLDGDLDPDTGETLLTALQAVLDAEAPSGSGDDRTPAQRRADALGEICRQWLDRSERPTVAGERPHVTLTVDARMLADPDALAEAAAPTSELDHAGPVHPDVARRLGCDASVMRWCSRDGPNPTTWAAERR